MLENLQCIIQENGRYPTHQTLGPPWQVKDLVNILFYEIVELIQLLFSFCFNLKYWYYKNFFFVFFCSFFFNIYSLLIVLFFLLCSE